MALGYQRRRLPLTVSPALEAAVRRQGAANLQQWLRDALRAALPAAERERVDAAEATERGAEEAARAVRRETPRRTYYVAGESVRALSAEEAVALYRRRHPRAWRVGDPPLHVAEYKPSKTHVKKK
jgi:hypothetical protein